jgi:tRNA (cmo5U34)-methyltransferase
MVRGATVESSEWTAEVFFDGMSEGYGAAIERCVPRYREMLLQILRCVPEGGERRDVLELGCGSGNLSALARGRFPEARIHLVDISARALKACGHRFSGDERFTFEKTDFKKLLRPRGSSDLVLSSIALHHLPDVEKAALFGKVHEWLRPGGLFVYSDQFAGATEEVTQKNLRDWKKEATALGATEAEWDAWMAHQKAHDHHAPLGRQMEWLGKAGFPVVDCPWRYLLWTVLMAHREDPGKPG